MRQPWFPLCLWLVAAPAFAAGTVGLPAGACVHGNVVSVDGFEDGAVMPSIASGGSGGVPGDGIGSLALDGLPTGTYYWHAPPNPLGNGPRPVLIVLHGASGSHALALDAAQLLRDQWAPVADAQGFVVLAPVSSGSQGGWLAPVSADDHPSDYDLIAAALAAIESSYDIERTRRYLWGYSAGGHVAHDLMLSRFNAALNEDTIAAWSVNAGALAALACAGMSSTQCNGLLSSVGRRARVDIRIGTSDSLLPHARADRDRFQARGWGDAGALAYAEFAGGHTYSPSQFPAIWNALCDQAVVP